LKGQIFRKDFHLPEKEKKINRLVVCQNSNCYRNFLKVVTNGIELPLKSLFRRKQTRHLYVAIKTRTIEQTTVSLQSLELNSHQPSSQKLVNPTQALTINQAEPNPNQNPIPNSSQAEPQ